MVTIIIVIKNRHFLLLIYLFTLYPNISFLSPPSSLLHRSFSLFMVCFSFQKGSTLLGIDPFPQPLAHQVFVGLGAPSPIESRQDSPFRGLKSTDRQTTDWGTGPTPDQGAHLLPMCRVRRSSPYLVFVWCFNLWEPPSVQVILLWWSSCGVPVLFWLPQSFPQLFHNTPWAPFKFWLWVSASFFIGCWVSLREQFYKALESLMVTGISSCPWDRSQFGAVIGWSFPPSLLCLSFFTFYR